MSDSNDPQPAESNERLEAYLDGLLPIEERAAFEREMADDPQLRAAVELQSRIDGSLGRMFVPPTAPVDLLERAAGDEAVDEVSLLPQRAEGAQSSRRRTILLVVAACVAWVIVGWRIFQQATDDGYQELALADIYERCVDNGFKPKWVCDDDLEFAQTFQQRQGTPLLLKAESKDVMVGLSYLKGITQLTTTMLARVEGEPVLVFVDKLERDSNPSKPGWGSGLSLFRQELEGLVLYELTPLSEPRVLSSFYVPDPSELPAVGREDPTEGDTVEENSESSDESQ